MDAKQKIEAAVDLPMLAKRLQSAAYNHGMDDNRPYMSDCFYAKADKKSTDALQNLTTALAVKEAELVRLKSALAPFVDFPADTLDMHAHAAFTMTVRGFHLHNAVRALTQPTEQP